MKKIIFSLFSLLSLFVCLISPFLYFFGKIKESDYKWMFFSASVGWFIFATLWASMRNKDKSF